MLETPHSPIFSCIPPRHETEAGVVHTTMLGEGITWSTEEQALWWIDIEGRALFRHRDGVTRRWPLAEKPGALAPRRGGGILLALVSGIGTFDPATGLWSRIAAFEPPVPHGRANDGKCDRQGRFWCGVMDSRGDRDSGGLYRLDAHGLATRCIDGLTVPNGLAWSPDGTRVYLADSPTGTIRVYDFDPNTGAFLHGRSFAEVPGPGVPDGATVDADGYLWTCEWGGSRLVRYAPDGAVDRIVPMPVSNPTCCTFGGPDLRTLYVTSARQGLDAEALAKEPEAGGVFGLDVGVAGVAEAGWSG